MCFFSLGFLSIKLPRLKWKGNKFCLMSRNCKLSSRGDIFLNTNSLCRMRILFKSRTYLQGFTLLKELFRISVTFPMNNTNRDNWIHSSGGFAHLKKKYDTKTSTPTKFLFCSNFTYFTTWL